MRIARLPPVRELGEVDDRYKFGTAEVLYSPLGMKIECEQTLEIQIGYRKSDTVIVLQKHMKICGGKGCTFYSFK